MQIKTSDDFAKQLLEDRMQIRIARGPKPDYIPGGKESAVVAQQSEATSTQNS